MKRSKFTSFLFTIALGLFAMNFATAQSSVDCQDHVNISLGDGCSAAIPYEAFNTWEPSCMLIKDANHNTIAALTGSGTLPNADKAKCGIKIDSFSFSSIVQFKAEEHSIMKGWRADDSADNCGVGDTIFVLKYEYEKIPSLDQEAVTCLRKYFMRDLHDSDLDFDELSSSTVIVPVKDKDEATKIMKDKGCEHADEFTLTDTEIKVVDKKSEVIIKSKKTEVWKSDTFSHTAPLKWVKGTQIVNLKTLADAWEDAYDEIYQHHIKTAATGDNVADEGVIATDAGLTAMHTADSWLVHGASVSSKKTEYCVDFADRESFSSSKPGPKSYLEFIASGYVNGAKAIQPGEYKYESYSQDGQNFCWGHITTEYKIWPTTPGKADTTSCVTFSDYDRSETTHYDYTSNTKQKLKEVCDWAVAAKLIRTDAQVAAAINNPHCYQHTVTHEDRFVKNFDWLCDTVMKVRTFFTDHPYGSLDKEAYKKLAEDTLLILPVPFDSVRFPDSLVALKCGIIDEYDPHSIAEYLYHGHKKGKSSLIYNFDQSLSDPNKYQTIAPCSGFASQYSSSLGKAASCSKMFKHASYNNWGVAQAYPYVERETKKQDPGLKAKFGSSAGVMSQNVKIPINKVVCNIAASKIDLHPVEICPGERKIFRTWTLLDWCSGTTKEQTQIIKVVDIDAPTITAIDGKSPTAAGDSDDDNTKGDEDHYFGDNSRDNTDSAEDGPGGSNNSADNKTHFIKITNPWGCTAAYTFPTLTLDEHCSTPSYEFELGKKHDDVNFKGSGTRYKAGDVVQIAWEHGKGLAYPKVRVYLWDECDNDATYDYYLKAVDKIPPVVVLHDELVVTLTANNEDFVGSIEHGPQGTPGEGIAKIYCNDVDAGSHDGDCGDLQACAIRRKGSDDAWADFVHFTCDDIGQVEVEYRATDWSGNTAIGWMTITVEQKNGPYIQCEDITVACNDPIHPDWVGYPHAYAICDAPELEYEDDYNVDDLCYKGYIDRTWRIVGTDVQCVQRITITSTDNGGDQSTFDPLSIRWPLHNNGKTLAEMNFPRDWTNHREVNAHGGCDNDGKLSESEWKAATMDAYFECEQGGSKEPTWTDPICGLVGKTFEDQHVKFNDGVCFKVLRTWTVIDWCTYDVKKGDIYPNENEYRKDDCAGKNYFKIRDDEAHPFKDGYYTFVQEILVVDKTQPVITAAKKDTVEVGAGSKTDDAACEGTWTGTASATDFCGDVDVSDVAEDGTKTEGPELDWEVKLVRIDKETGAETVVKDAFGREWRPIAEGGNEVGHEELYSDENQSPTASFTFTGQSHETYHVKWRVTDGCNNRSEEVTVVTFEDVKAPVLLCYADLSTNAMSTNGEAEVWANDYGKAFDCDGEKVDVWFKDADGNLVSSLTFTCDDLGGNVAATKEFNVYARDEKGNESFCEVTLRIVDSNGACGDGATGAAVIAGELATEQGDMVELAEVFMGEKSMMTGVNGQYAFDNNAMGLSYTLEASKNDNHLNGVSTLDLVLIQKHILGLDQLDSGFKVIAADINNDANVSAIDLVELRKVILGITNEFTNNTSWRFGDANQTFDDELNPFATFVEAINVDFLTEDTENDFIAIKVGDVSGNAIANSLQVDSRSNSNVAFEANDEFVSTGELVSVSFRSNDFAGMNAFQFTMNTAGLELTNVISGAIEMSNENVAAFDGRLTAAWSSVEAVTTGDDLFTLEFRALTDTRLSNAISMTSSITPARAYNSELERFNTSLVFNSEEGSTVGSAFELMQNTPNPFDNVTSIGFNLGEAGPATLTVFDVTGKTVRVESGNFDRGYNEITLTKGDLGTSGVLYYQLESGDFTATRKMILID